MCLGQFLTESIKEQKKEQEAAEIKKDDITKVLAGELANRVMGCPQVICDGRCRNAKPEYFTEIVRDCWIAWAKEQAKNGA